MRIAVLGAGRVGTALAAAFIRSGHDVALASAHPGTDRPGVGITTDPTDALLGAQVAVLAVPAPVVADLVMAQADLLDGMLVIDTTNRFSGARLHQLDLLTVLLPDSRLARVFSTVSAEMIADPTIDGGPPDLLWCGPGEADGAIIEALVRSVGFVPRRLGGLDVADVLDGVTRLAVTLRNQAGFGRRQGLVLLGAPSGSAPLRAVLPQQGPADELVASAAASALDAPLREDKAPARVPEPVSA